MPLRLLCLSNGHGEDQIALGILEQLQAQAPEIEIAVLPLVGVGKAYASAGMALVGPTKAMPSGGFVYMDGKQLARDVQGGLLRLTGQQWQAIRQWAGAGHRRPERSLVLAVGDIVPLLFAWLSGQPYAFVGTAKSEYYLRDEQGPLVRQGGWRAKLESASASIFLPWERWLMGRPRCLGVFPRDRLTAKLLQRWPIPAYDLGNPMMDGLGAKYPVPPIAQQATAEGKLKLLLLPGSRPPEAFRNWELILEAVKALVNRERERGLIFLAAVAPGLEPSDWVKTLEIQAWRRLDEAECQAWGSWLPAGAIAFQRRQHRLLLSQASFGDYLQGADGAIAMAGTATEQFVGLGKPAFILPGEGPQFTPAFAEAQQRLLGPSVIVVEPPSRLPEALERVMGDPDRLRGISENGHLRMGEPGAGARIAATVLRLIGQS